LLKDLSATLAAIAFSTIISCGQDSNKQGNKTADNKAAAAQASISDWKTLNQSEYSIQYPQDWELSQKGEMGTALIIFSPLKTKEYLFKENVNLMIQPLPGTSMTLEKFTDLSLEQIKTMITNSKIEESKKINDETSMVIFTGNQGDYTLKFAQYYKIKNNKAYIVTFTTENSEFDQYRDTGLKILNSFSLQ
jgi:serine/threonine-protein kinase